MSSKTIMFHCWFLNHFSRNHSHNVKRFNLYASYKQGRTSRANLAAIPKLSIVRNRWHPNWIWSKSAPWNILVFHDLAFSPPDGNSSWGFCICPSNKNLISSSSVLYNLTKSRRKEMLSVVNVLKAAPSLKTIFKYVHAEIKWPFIHPTR